MNSFNNKILISIDAATRNSGVAISLNSKIIALFPISLEQKLSFSGEKITKDTTLIPQILNSLEIPELHNLQNCYVEILIERSNHGVDSLTQKLNLYVGLFLSAFRNWLAKYNLTINNIKLLPPREWQLHAFGSKDIDRQTGKQLSIEYANNWLKQNNYSITIDNDDIADALNILIFNENLRDIKTIQTQKVYRTIQPNLINSKITFIESKIEKLKQQAELKRSQKLASLLSTKKYYSNQNLLKSRQEEIKTMEWTNFLTKKDNERLYNFYDEIEKLKNQKQTIRKNVILKTEDQQMNEKQITLTTETLSNSVAQFQQLDLKSQETILKKFLVKKFPRRFFNGQDYVINDNNTITIINPEIRPALITGTRLRSILSPNIFESPLLIWSKFFNFTPPVYNEIYTLTGNINEPKLINTALNIIQKSMPDHELVAYSPDPQKEQYNYFRNIDSPLTYVFGGLPDGLMADKKNTIKTLNLDENNQIIENIIDPRVTQTDKIVLLECKTAQQKKRADFNSKGIDPSYFYQATLYTYLLNLNQYQVLVGYLKPEEYLKDDITFDDQNFQIFTYKLKNEIAKKRFEDDLRLATINYIESFVGDALTQDEKQKLLKDEDILLSVNEQIVENIANFLKQNNVETITLEIAKTIFNGVENISALMNSLPLSASNFLESIRQTLTFNPSTKFIPHSDSYTHVATTDFLIPYVENNKLSFKVKKFSDSRGLNAIHAKQRLAADILRYFSYHPEYNIQYSKPSLEELTTFANEMIEKYWITNIAKKTSPVFKPTNYTQKSDDELWVHYQISNLEEWSQLLLKLYQQSQQFHQQQAANSLIGKDEKLSAPMMNYQIVNNDFVAWLESQDIQKILNENNKNTNARGGK